MGKQWCRGKGVGVSLVKMANCNSVHEKKENHAGAAGGNHVWKRDHAGSCAGERKSKEKKNEKERLLLGFNVGEAGCKRKWALVWAVCRHAKKG